MNDAVLEGIPVVTEVLPIEEAKKKGAVAMFGIIWLFGRQWLVVDVTPYVKFDPTGFTALPVLLMLAWGVLWAVIDGRSYSMDDKATTVSRAVWISMNAGFWEELTYRGFIFASAAALIPLSNFIFGGFAGVNLVNWLYQVVYVPLANVFTFSMMSDHLFTPNWLVGAALASALIKFRDAHEHLGLFGMINAWFCGMVLFWIMFNYGILTGMAVHAVYDIIVLGTRAAKSEHIGYRWLR